MQRTRTTRGARKAVRDDGTPCVRRVLGLTMCLGLLLGAVAGCSSTPDTPQEFPPPTPKTDVTPGGAGQDARDDSQPVVVTFTKPGCPACFKLAPVLARLKREYAGKIRFNEVDTAVHKKAVIEFGITGTPTVIIYVNKEEFKNMLNPREKEFRESLDAALAAKG